MGTEVAEGRAKTGAPPGVEPRPPKERTRPDKPEITATYIPGIDGIRGCFLWLLLTYHHGFRTFPGAVLAMSMFFTLSGYLICTLVLSEWARKDRVDVGRFLERRARRLLPAAFVAIALVIALEYVWGLGAGPRFQGDVLGALGYFANWRDAFSGADYAAFFKTESPLQHFWSLAVEEQFYLAFPLLFVGLMAITRGRWRLVGALFGLGAAASFLSAWLTARAHGNTGIAYYATYTRAGEILAGVALAFLVLTNRAKRVLASQVGGMLVRWGGVIGIVGTVWLWRVAGLTDPELFRGATALDAVFTSMIILACAGRTGVAAKFLEFGPMRNVGKLCYSVYLFHWPLFLLLDEERTGLSTWPLFALRVAVTMVAATASYHLIECPVREGKLKLVASRFRVSGVLAAGAAVIVALALVVPIDEPETVDLASLSTDEINVETIPAAATPDDAPTAPTTPRVLLMGDSVAWSISGGFRDWNASQQQQVQLDAQTAPACTLAQPGLVRHLGIEEDTATPACVQLHEQFPALIRDGNYDAVILVIGGKDIAERQIDGAWRHFGDPAYDEWFTTQAQAFADKLTAAAAPLGTKILWASMPHVYVPRADDPSGSWEDYPDNDPPRVDRLNEILGQVFAGRPGFQMLDIASWTKSVPGGEYNPDYRFDGAHYTVRGAYELTQWMVPQLVDAAATR